MISDIIEITSSGENMGAALDVTRKVAAYGDLVPKNTLHLRLLAEEMMGLMRSIAGEVKGKFWIEGEEDVYKLHLKVDAALSAALRALFDREHRVVRLFDPPFTGGGAQPGYIASYGPGFRENGGQYTHAALWLVRALRPPV